MAAGHGQRTTAAKRGEKNDRPTDANGERSEEGSASMHDEAYHARATRTIREEPEAYKVVPLRRDDAPEKLPPQNFDAEVGLLGSMLIDPEAIEAVLPFLRASDFYDHRHRAIFQAAHDLYEAGGPADFITVCDELERRGKLADLGGTGYVGSFANQVPSSRNARYYGEIVQRKSLMRQLIDTAGKIAGIANEDGDPDVALVNSQALIYELAQVGIAQRRYEFLPFSQLMDLPDQQYLLDGILADDSISLTYAESGIGKTFTWLDIALSMAFGRTRWHGIPLKPGAVAYIAAEGGRGIKKRVEAWCTFHGHAWSDDVPFYVLPRAVPLLQDASVAELLTALRALPEPPQLIVIDTLARSMDGGDENLAKDINSIFATATRLRELGGAHVAIIHHTGKDAAKGGRGSYALKGNADTELYFTAADGCIQVTTSKQKEDEKNDPLLLKLQKVWLDEAMTRSSCVIVDAAGHERPTPLSTPLMDPSRLSCLVSLGGFTTGAHANDWQRRSGFPYSTWNRHRRWLIEHGFVTEYSGFYVLSDSGRLLTANHNQNTAMAAMTPLPTTATTLKGGSGGSASGSDSVEGGWR